MKYTILLLTILMLFSCAVQNIPAIEREEIQYYLSTNDFKNNNPSAIGYTKIKEIGSDYIRVYGFFDNESNQKIKTANTAWALKYNNENYLNMRYSDDYQNIETYAKFNVQGKICALYINDNTSKKIKSGGTNYGGGLAGVLMKESDKWGKNWKDLEGKKNKILICNTDIIETRHKNGYRNSKAKLLTRKNFNRLLGTNLTKKQIEKLSFEQTVEIINQLNMEK